MNKTPPVYVELVGAESLLIESEKGRQIEFGGEAHWIPKAHCKIEDDKVYVEQWLASANASGWKAKFVEGTKRTKMQVIQTIPQGSIDEAIALMREALAILRTLS